MSLGRRTLGVAFLSAITLVACGSNPDASSANRGSERTAFVASAEMGSSTGSGSYGGTGSTGTGSTGTGSTGTGSTGTGSTGTAALGETTAFTYDASGNLTGIFNVSSDINNCGAVGRVCPGSGPNGQSVCIGGTCTVVCASGYVSCGTACLSQAKLSSDPANCGSCGNTCPVPSNGAGACTSGTCSFTCDSGYTPSAGACVPSGMGSSTAPLWIYDTRVLIESPAFAQWWGSCPGRWLDMSTPGILAYDFNSPGALRDIIVNGSSILGNVLPYAYGSSQPWEVQTFEGSTIDGGFKEFQAIQSLTISSSVGSATLDNWPQITGAYRGSNNELVFTGYNLGAQDGVYVDVWGWNPWWYSYSWVSRSVASVTASPTQLTVSMAVPIPDGTPFHVSVSYPGLSTVGASRHHVDWVDRFGINVGPVPTSACPAH